MHARRYVVKLITSGSPAWSGVLWGVGCKYLQSAEILFERRKTQLADGDALLLIDRQEKIVLKAAGTSDPAKTADWFNAW